MHADLFPEVPRVPPADDINRRFTPRALIEDLHREFRFTVDAASEATAPSSEVIGRFWSIADDGLAQSWAGERVWVNPPFDEIPTWVARAHRAAWSEGCPLVVMLIPANRTEQPFWHEFIEPKRDRGPLWGPTLETRFLKSRTRFGYPGNPEGLGQDSPPFGCVLLIWRTES